MNTKDIRVIRNSDRKKVADYLYKCFSSGEIPPYTLAEWKARWFPTRGEIEVYQLIKEASQKLAHATGGKIQFRYNAIEEVWRFHVGVDDYLMLFHGTERQIAGRINTLNIDWDYGKTLYPKVEDEIHIIDTPLLTVDGGRIKELKTNWKQKYETTNIKKK